MGITGRNSRKARSLKGVGTEFARWLADFGQGQFDAGCGRMSQGMPQLAPSRSACHVLTAGALTFINRSLLRTRHNSP